MTYSETKFRNYLKKLFTDPQTYIKKLPDKKQGVGRSNIGMPDYLVVSEGRTLWFEVKMSPPKIKNSFNLNLITDNQYIEFTKLLNAGAKIFLAIYVNKVLYIVDFKKLQLLKYVGNVPSVSIKELEEWRIKW